MIAYCGLDCGKCDAYLATVNDDQALRERTAERWSRITGRTILPEDIRCDGCRSDGVRPEHCEANCRVRPCASGRGYETCGECPELEGCRPIAPILETTPQAMENLRGRRRGM